MPGVRRGLVTLVLAVGLLAGGVTAGASAASDATQATDAIWLYQTFSLTPDEPGTVSMEVRYAVPNGVLSLGTAVPDNATVTATDGFEPRNATYYEWDGARSNPTITYALDVNRTTSRSGPKATNGSYLAVDVGEWALFSRPAISTDFLYTGDEPALERRTIVEGEGAAGEWLVYLGEQDTFASAAHDQSFRLVVPATATMAESPRTVLAALERASDRLRVGDRDEEVFVVAAPTDGVPWAVRGLQTGDADLWVRDGERLSDPDNVWIHEYVHTRQAFETEPSARWLDEGLPAYYATLFTFEHQSMTFDGFVAQLSRGNESTYDDVELSTPSTWEGFADYYRGALVAGELDRQLRRATDGERSLQSVFAELNTRERANESAFLDAVERAGDDRVRDRAVDYTSGSASVSTWNRSAHRAAFGPLPARIEFALPDGGRTEGYRIGGPFRNVSTAPASPIELVRGETLAIDVRAHNDGGTAGSFDAVLRLNGTRVASESGVVDPNGTAVVTLEHTFVLPGQYVASVDGESVPVHVRQPSVATVTNLTVHPTEVRQGDSAIATVVVRNYEDEPAERELIVTRDFREVARETVHLDANEIERVDFAVPFPQPGTTRVGVNSREAVDVAVTPVPMPTGTPTPNGTAVATPGTPTPSGTSDGTGAGFGMVVVATAFAAWALLVRRWAS